MAIISDDDEFENIRGKSFDKCQDVQPVAIDFDKSFENNIRLKSFANYIGQSR